MIRIAFYYCLVALALFAAYRHGDRETRLAAGICLVASLLSTVFMRFNQQIALNVALIDLAVLAGFVALALRTRRFWPLWVAGLQLTTVLGHALRLLQPSLLNIAYAAAMRFWAYPILIILVVAAWRTKRYQPQRPLQPA